MNSMDGLARCRGLAAALVAYHTNSAAHCTRTSATAVAIGIRLGLTSVELDVVSQVGVLHDIGKLHLPHATLDSPQMLTAAEWAQIRQHPDAGADLLGSIVADLDPVAEGIRCHHERWDGAGYPRGLAGIGIPLSARICAVADSWDVMTHDRSYRDTLTPDQVIQQFKQGSGSQFDPTVVQAALPLIQENQ